jgi:hypothetical protein
MEPKSMSRTSEFAGVPTDPVPVANELQHFILRERACLPKALNNSPTKPSDPRAIVTRKHMQQGLCLPMRHLLIVSGCDVADGVPVATAAEPYRQAIQFLHLVKSPTRPRDLAVLEMDETKAQGALDIAQHKVRAMPDQPDALRAVIDALAEYETAAEALRHHYEARLMIAAGTTRRAMEIVAR